MSHQAPAVIIGALIAFYGTAAVATGDGWLTGLAGVTLIAALVILAATRTPKDERDDGIEALMDATRERLPRRWTAEDWAELDELTAPKGLDQ